MNFSDDWGAESTAQIERSVIAPRPTKKPKRKLLRSWRAIHKGDYEPPPYCQHDDDRPTFTELQAIGDCHAAS